MVLLCLTFMVKCVLFMRKDYTQKKVLGRVYPVHLVDGISSGFVSPHVHPVSC